LDELIIAGELQESSKKSVLKIVSRPSGYALVDVADRQVAQSDAIEEGMSSLFSTLPIQGQDRMFPARHRGLINWMSSRSKSR
jgi:hypothetical protein